MRDKKTMMKERTREKSRKNEKKTRADDFMHYYYTVKKKVP